MFRPTPTNIRLTLCLLLICCGIPVMAQQTANTVVPTLVKFTGTLSGTDGQPLTGTQSLTFLLYKEETGGAPLWMETQNVQPDKNGHYSVKLGSASVLGLPAEVFMTGEARWLAIQVNGQAEGTRTLLLSVPYAFKAADAETLGGKPASAFMAAPVSGAGLGQPALPADQANEIVCSSSTTCKTGFVPVFATSGGSAQVRGSALFQSGKNIGINTTSPAFALDIVGDVHTIGSFLGTGGEFSSVSANSVNAVNTGTVVNATMTGTGNGIAAVQGSASATGAAGFTFGVIGQSASAQGRGVFGSATGATGVGVIGESSGASGFGVIGKDLSGGGFAFSATGNAQQDRSSGGWAKALVFVSAHASPYHIARCYNSTLVGKAATTPPCGFTLTEVTYAEYTIDFGFEVDDRFWSVTANSMPHDNNNSTIIANTLTGAFFLGSNTKLLVQLTTDAGDFQTSDFSVVIY